MNAYNFVKIDRIPSQMVDTFMQMKYDALN